MLETQRLAGRFRGALLGAAIGEAIGRQQRAAPAARRKAGLGNRDTDELTYGGGTELLLATGESLVQMQSLTGPHLASTLAARYRAHPERDYSSGLRTVLQLLNQGVIWCTAGSRLARGQDSYSSEPARRIAPLALFAFRRPEDIRHLAESASRVTHHNELAVEGAVLQASALAFLLRSEESDAVSRTKIVDLLTITTRNETFEQKLRHFHHLFPAANLTDVRELLGTNDAAAEAFPAALYAFLCHSRDFEAVLTCALQVSDACDATATLAGALAGAARGEDALPEVWRERIENRQQLTDLADALLVLAITGSSRAIPLGAAAS